MAGMIMAAALLTLGGCATVTRGTMDGLEVNSVPSGATVMVKRTDREGFIKKEIKANRHLESAQALMESSIYKTNAITEPLVCTTPATLNLARKGTYEITISQAGYEPQTVSVVGVVSGKGSMGMAGNVLVGGLIGAGIDAGSGAMKDLSPNPVEVTLQAEGSSLKAAAPAEADMAGPGDPR